MEEEKKEVEEKKEPETEPEVITKANEAAERLENAIKKQEELIRRQEELAAKKALSGQAEAGQPSEDKELSAEDYAAAFLDGKIKGELKGDIIKQ